MANLQQRFTTTIPAWRPGSRLQQRPFLRGTRTRRKGFAATLACLGLFALASGQASAQGVKISALPDATSAGLTDMIPCVQGDTTRRCTPAEFLALLTGGVGIGISSQTISTASNEADFLTSGALTCGASTQGKVQVHSTTPLQYCDNAGTPTLRYAAYGNATGECLSAADNSIALGAKTTGGYAASASEGGDATGLACTTCVDATDIASDAVTEPKLKAVDTASDEECLTYETTTGDFEWQSCGSADTDDQTAAEVVYTPADGADWTNPDPDDVADGLDKLADRLTVEEAESGGIGGTTGTDDNALLRADGIGGSTLQSSLILVSDAGAIAGATTIDASSAIRSQAGFVVNVLGDQKMILDSALSFSVDGSIKFFDSADIDSGAAHVGLIPGATGELKVTNGSTGSGDLLLDEEQELRFAEAAVNGDNYLALKAPATVTTTQTCTLEDDSSMVPDSCVGDGTDDDLPDADEIVESMLKAVDSATDEECLTFETTTGDFEWQSCGAGGGIGGTLGTADNAATRADGTGGGTAQGSALAIEDYVSTSPASDYVSVTPFGADSIISTRLNYVGGNGSPGVYGAGILINGTTVGIQASGSYFKTWDGGGGNAPIFIGSRIAFTGLTSGHVAIRSTSDPGIEIVAGDDSAFATLKAKHITADGSFRAVAQTLTIADNGTGTAATGTLTFTRSLAKCDCGDANGCDVTLSETGMVDGWQWTVVNISANPCNFADTSGVSELPAGGVALGQWDSLSGYYVTDRFVLTSTSNN